MVRLASLMRSAIKRRRPMTLISVISAAGAAEAGSARDAAAPADAVDGGGLTAALGAPLAAARSSRTIRPPGPLPTTVARSIPASCARRRFAGEVMMRPTGAAGAAAAWTPEGSGAAGADGAGGADTGAADTGAADTGGDAGAVEGRS